jgi:hypothetical protein
VQGFVDRHGRPRFYFRRPGFDRVPLPGLPWSPEFMAAYETALAGQPMQVASASVKPGTMRALAVSYYNSVVFRSMKASTQGVYRNIIDRFCGETDKNGQKYGDKHAATLQRGHVVALMAARAQKPDSANGLRKVLRAMMAQAVDIGLRKDDPTQGVKPIKPKSKTGFHRWTEEEIAQFEAHHEIGSRPRLALALGLYFGQARTDVVSMGEQHIRDELLLWVRQKTERSTALELAIPVHPTLRAIIDATPSEHLTFLVTAFGKPFTAPGFGNWFRDQCNCGSTALLISRIAKGGVGTARRGGLHSARDRGHYRPCQLERDRALHGNSRSQTVGDQRHGEGENQNIECQTGREV